MFYPKICLLFDKTENLVFLIQHNLDRNAKFSTENQDISLKSRVFVFNINTPLLH